MYFRSIAVAAIAAFALVGAVRAEDPAASWLFIVDADAMSFDGATLTLEGVGAETLAFTDRPHRMVRRISTEEFVAIWQKADFGGEPPNAGVNGVADGQQVSSVVELSEPRFEGTTLVFTAAALEGAVLPAAEEVSVFVDAFPTAVNDQITD